MNARESRPWRHRLARLARAISVAVLGAVAACASSPRTGAPATSPTPTGDAQVPRELAGVTSDGSHVFVARAARRWATPAATVVEAVAPAADRPAPPIWHTELAGHGGRLALAGGHLFAVVDGPRTAAGIALRGEVGAAVVALDAASGKLAWKLPLDAPGRVEVTSLAAIADGAIIAGSFSGTLRIGAREMSPAGGDDGFVARLAATGDVAWLARIGGPRSDSVNGVAVEGDRVVLAGLAGEHAELAGHPMPDVVEHGPDAGVFVAELDAAGALRWTQRLSTGSASTVTGVAIDARGRIALAANVHGTVHAGSTDLVARAPSGLVAWWLPDGAPGPAILIETLADEWQRSWSRLNAITAIGDRVLVAGRFTGRMSLGNTAIGADEPCYQPRGLDSGAGFSLALDAGGASGPTISSVGLAIDGARALAAPGERVVLAAFGDSSRELRLSERKRAPAVPSDEIFVTEPNEATWTMMNTHGFVGSGRSAITHLVPISGGFVAGVAQSYPPSCMR